MPPEFLMPLAFGTMLLHLTGLGGGYLVRRHARRLWPALAIACSLAGACLLASS